MYYAMYYVYNYFKYKHICLLPRHIRSCYIIAWELCRKVGSLQVLHYKAWRLHISSGTCIRSVERNIYIDNLYRVTGYWVTYVSIMVRLSDTLLRRRRSNVSLKRTMHVVQIQGMENSP